MFFKKKFLIVVVSTFFFTSLAFAESNVQFGGYARAGFGLNLSEFNKSYSQLGENSFSSRHIRHFNYIQLDLTKNFENGSKLAISFDTDETFQTTHQYLNWDAGTTFRTRNAYYSIPVSDNLSVWAGVRYFLFTDIRVLDYLLDYSAMGAGVTVAKNTEIFVSVDRKNKNKTSGPEDLTAVVRTTIDLNSNLNISPEVQVTNYTKGKQKLNEVESEAKSNIGVLARAVVGFHTDSMWNNIFASYSRQPIDYGKETRQVISAGDSGSFTFTDSFGLLVGALVEYTKDSVESQVYEKGTAKEGDTTKSKLRASIDLQPVYFLTDRAQLALDLNKTIKTKYTSAEETPEAWYITPILRYSFNKDTVANAQIYTSVTYSMFDWKGINNGKKNTDSMLTAQTGFEIAF